MLTLEGDILWAIITRDELVLEIKYNHNDNELHTFEIVAVLKNDKT